MKVGLVGLGIMGMAYAQLLRRADADVVGVDIAAKARARLETHGGIAHESLGDWVQACDVIIVAVSLPDVLAQVAESLGKLLEQGQVVVETGTFTMDDKLSAKAAVEANGAILLDCPVSGTGALALQGELVMIASGPVDAISKVRAVLDVLTKSVIIAGDFGTGSKLKYVANHLVALHNAAAAEALHYADSLQLDRDVVFDLLANGAASSTMLQHRMPMMIAGNYKPPTATLGLFEKDLSIIQSDIKRVDANTPLFNAAASLYKTANETLPETYDTAAVFEVFDTNKA